MRTISTVLCCCALVLGGCAFDLDLPWPDIGGKDLGAVDRGAVEGGSPDGPAADQGDSDGPAPTDGPRPEGPTTDGPPKPHDGPLPPDGPSMCGNGKLDPGEACEGSKLGGKTCKALGDTGGTLYCSPKCTYDLAACFTTKCGYKKITLGEDCEGTDLGGKTCKALGFDGGALKCGHKCLFDKSGCHKCGDGVKNGAEACDAKDLGGKTCKALGHVGGTLKCGLACAFDKSGCHDCGNGKLDKGEACEGTNLGGKTCKALGHTGGTLTCTKGCAHDTSGCYHVMDPLGIKLSGSVKGTRHQPSAAFDGTNYLTLWGEAVSGSTTSYDIRGLRLTPAGVKLDKTAFTISAATGGQNQPSAAWGKGVYLVVWTDYRSGSDYDVYAARVNASGKVLDPAGIAVCAKAGWQNMPRVAFDGTNFLVVWADKRTGNPDIYGTRITPAGKVLEAGGFLIRKDSKELNAPDVAFGGGHYLVVWQRGKYSDSATDINGVRVSTAGKVMDSAPIGVSVSAAAQNLPRVASDGSSFMVVWYDLRGASSTLGDIRGTLVDKSGKVLSPSSTAICGQKKGQSRPAIAHAGGVYWVVWQDYRLSSWKNPNVDIYGTRVSAAGKPLDGDGFSVSAAAGDQYGPNVIHGKQNSLVLWEDKRNGSSYEIYGTRLTP